MRWRRHAMEKTRDGEDTRWRRHAMEKTRDGEDTRWRVCVLGIVGVLVVMDGWRDDNEINRWLLTLVRGVGVAVGVVVGILVLGACALGTMSADSDL
jgi:hypothetical protein